MAKVIFNVTIFIKYDNRHTHTHTPLYPLSLTTSIINSLQGNNRLIMKHLQIHKTTAMTHTHQRQNEHKI